MKAPEDADAVPLDLQRATAELAYRLEEKDLDKEPTRGILSVGAGRNAVAVTFDPHKEARVLVRSVVNFLKPFLANGGSSAFGRNVRCSRLHVPALRCAPRDPY